MKEQEVIREMGQQPLDTVMQELELDNHALVAASGEHLTHKEVAKGRKGRRLTPNLMKKITRAMNRLSPRTPEWTPRDLFNYAVKEKIVHDQEN